MQQEYFEILIKSSDSKFQMKLDLPALRNNSEMYTRDQKRPLKRA